MIRERHNEKGKNGKKQTKNGKNRKNEIGLTRESRGRTTAVIKSGRSKERPGGRCPKGRGEFPITPPIDHDHKRQTGAGLPLPLGCGL